MLSEPSSGKPPSPLSLLPPRPPCRPLAAPPAPFVEMHGHFQSLVSSLCDPNEARMRVSDATMSVAPTYFPLPSSPHPGSLGADTQCSTWLESYRCHPVVLCPLDDLGISPLGEGPPVVKRKMAGSTPFIRGSLLSHSPRRPCPSVRVMGQTSIEHGDYRMLPFAREAAGHDTVADHLDHGRVGVIVGKTLKTVTRYCC